MKEVWRPVYGYTGIYEVSNLGAVRKVSDGILLKVSGKRYLKVRLYKNKALKYFSVHRLVAKAFCEKKAKHTQVNHINGNKFDNRATNLEWCTASENILHAYRLKGKYV